jgi:antirestriction protein ArdC
MEKGFSPCAHETAACFRFSRTGACSPHGKARKKRIDEPRADHAQYLGNWLGLLKADKRAIFTAASKTSEAVANLTTLQGG